MDSLGIKGSLIRKLRRLKFVPRWCVVPTINKQNVAEHSFHVAWLCVWVSARVGLPVSAYSLIVALTHDAEEAVTGDMPTPSKPASASEATLDRCVLKVADCLEAALFLSEELSMGNSSVSDVLDDVVDRGSVWADKLAEMCNNDEISFVSLFHELMHLTNPSIHPGMMSTKS